MKSYEASGRTVEEAISSGLTDNGLSIGDVSVEILEEGSKGLFGLFGSRDAKIRLTLNEEESQSDTYSVFKDSLSTRSSQKSVPEPKKAEPVPQAQQPERKAKPASEMKAPREPQPVQEQPAASRPPRVRKPRETTVQQEVPEAPIEYVREVRTLTPVEHADPSTPAGIAQQFLQQLTNLMGLTIAVSVALDAEGHVFATLDGDPQGILIGRRGETLDALQYLTSLKINKGQENYVRVTIDSEGYRQKREEALVRLANRMANRAKKTGRRVTMEPMNPYERRIFHSALQATPGIATHSEGEEPNRHVIITPVKDEGGQAGSAES